MIFERVPSKIRETPEICRKYAKIPKYGRIIGRGRFYEPARWIKLCIWIVHGSTTWIDETDLQLSALYFCSCSICWLLFSYVWCTVLNISVKKCRCNFSYWLVEGVREVANHSSADPKRPRPSQDRDLSSLKKIGHFILFCFGNRGWLALVMMKMISYNTFCSLFFQFLFVSWARSQLLAFICFSFFTS